MLFFTRYSSIAKNISTIKRYFRTSTCNSQVNKIRNLGILAHIDAGKTTTTERMLFYSGTISHMGEVHHGNTVTDYMEQERQRGITIISAAVSFPWNDHQFNLIDTPGHIDFTMEVEQSLAVIDGAVVILDGSAGVEAQTLTVWRQCDNHCLPRIVYINKMDRKDADIVMCLQSLHEKLDINPICLQIPVREKVDKKLEGVIDVINLEYVKWHQDSRGRKYDKYKLTESDDPSTWEKAMNARRNITDVLSSYDDILADQIIESNSLDNIDSKLLRESIKRSTLGHKIIPVLCGSSYKNMGVQLLMDSVIDYLPSPDERNEMYNCFKKDLCARVFKVQHHDQKGVLTYFRIFSGKLTKGQKIYNIHKEKLEQGNILYIPYADEYQMVSEVKCGNVAVMSGLKTTMCGDLITSTANTASSAKKELIENLKEPSNIKQLNIPNYMLNKIMPNNPNFNPEEAASTLLGIGTTIPDSVFFCSIEPPSQREQTALDNALIELQREDPSLRVTNNLETGQLVLSGMGELHLEIIKHRIVNEYKIDVELGDFQIAYKESIDSICKDSHIIDRVVKSQRQFVNITLSLYPMDKQSTNILQLDHSPDNAANLAHIYPKRLQMIKNGITSAFLCGPKLGYPIENVGVILHWFEIERGTADSMISAATSQCIRKIFSNTHVNLLEPIMSVEIVTPERFASTIMNDLTKRRGVIENFSYRGKNKVFECKVPLAGLMGYSTNLRSISSGMATFSMEFYNYQVMNSNDEEMTIKQIRGY